jgi:hypothetical protein
MLEFVSILMATEQQYKYIVPSSMDLHEKGLKIRHAVEVE